VQQRIFIADHYGPIKFFRRKILNLPLPEILQLSEKYEKEVKGIKKDCLKLCWYMRGLSYAEVMNMSWDEREIIGEIIKENLETTKKSGLPFF
jgi:hypothetical protein